VLWDTAKGGIAQRRRLWMFELHPRIQADTHALGDWPLSRVLLMNDSTYPWLTLVPRRPDIVEIFDLTDEDGQTLWQELRTAARLLKQATGCDKINVVTLGNVVAQMHVHVIARWYDDVAWPRPVFGVQPAVPYTEAGLAEMKAKLAVLFA
jgi:diadenosine tetraphosphate (Ap4A) HIT family hydrolase